MKIKHIYFIILYVFSFSYIIHIIRPPIPVYFINPILQWRTHEVNIKYASQNNTEYKKMLEHRLAKQDEYIVKNDYPYSLFDGVTHWLLWLSRNKSNITREDIFSILYSKFPSQNVKFYENFYFRRSIPEYKHYHVFVW